MVKNNFEVKFRRDMELKISESQDVKSKGYIDCDIIIIEAGLGNPSDNVEYPAEVLRNSVPIFENAAMFMDHPAENEEWNRPERSFRDKIGAVREASWDEARQAVRGKARIYDPETVHKLLAMREAGTLDHAAISLRALAMGKPNASRDGAVVTSFTKILSVDLVTAAGAGGVIETAESAAGGGKVSQNKSRSIYCRESMKGSNGMTPEQIAELNLSNANLKLQLAEAERTADSLRAQIAALSLKNDLHEVVALAESALPAGVLAAVKPNILAATTKEGAMVILESAKAVNTALGGKAGGEKPAHSPGLDLGESSAPRAIQTQEAGTDMARAWGEQQRRERLRALGHSPDSAFGKAYIGT